jgi:hypothetical protein
MSISTPAPFVVVHGSVCAPWLRPAPTIAIVRPALRAAHTAAHSPASVRGTTVSPSAAAYSSPLTTRWRRVWRGDEVGRDRARPHKGRWRRRTAPGDPPTGGALRSCGHASRRTARGAGRGAPPSTVPRGAPRAVARRTRAVAAAPTDTRRTRLFGGRRTSSVSRRRSWPRSRHRSRRRSWSRSRPRPRVAVRRFDARPTRSRTCGSARKTAAQPAPARFRRTADVCRLPP